ncbi:hypothetical protein ACKKBG_A06925 [Auxenochlorella protothecoides x Auxenochlorella symbiontica]
MLHKYYARNRVTRSTRPSHRVAPVGRSLTLDSEPKFGSDAEQPCPSAGRGLEVSPLPSPSVGSNWEEADSQLSTPLGSPRSTTGSYTSALSPQRAYGGSFRDGSVSPGKDLPTSSPDHVRAKQAPSPMRLAALPEAHAVDTPEALPGPSGHIVAFLAAILALAQILCATLGLLNDPSIVAHRAKEVWRNSGADLATQRIWAGAGACAGVLMAVRELGAQLLGSRSSGKARIAS